VLFFQVFVKLFDNNHTLRGAGTVLELELVITSAKTNALLALRFPLLPLRCTTETQHIEELTKNND